MTSGGANTQATALNPSVHSIKRTQTRPAYAPLALSRVSAKATQEGTVVVNWLADSKTLPPFSYDVKVYDNSAGTGKPLGIATAIQPHARSVEIKLISGKSALNRYVRLTCTDILGNRSMHSIVSKP